MGSLRKEIITGGEFFGFRRIKNHSMNKKYIIALVIIIAVITITGGYFLYKYWQKGTPEYSFRQLQTAIKNKDANSVDKFFDVNSVIDNNFPRVKSRELDYFKYDIYLLNYGGEEKYKNTFKNAIYETVRGNVGKKPGNIPALFAQLEQLKKPIFVLRDETAILQYKYQRTPDELKYQFDFVFRKQSDRTWRITDIQGLEDLLTSNIADEIRVKDLETVAGILNLHTNTLNLKWNDSHPDDFKSSYPAAENYEQLVKFLLDDYENTNWAESLSNDPLSRYGNTYFYAVDNKSNPKSYVLKAIMDIGNTMNLATVAEKLHFSNILIEGDYYGLNCHKPAYCIGAPKRLLKDKIIYE